MESGDSRRGSGAGEFAAAFRDAINARRVTLSWVQERLRARGNQVSMATLSYWRSGSRHPESMQSLAAVADIEELLHLDVGALSGLLRSSHRTGPLGPNLFPLDEHAIEQAVKEAFAALGAEYPDTSRELTTHSVTDVDASGNVSASRTRSIVQSTVGTITAIPFIELTPGLPTPAPHFSADFGGRIAKRFSHPNGEVHGVLLELDAPLTSPNTAMVEWSVAYPPDYPSQRETGHAVARQCRELLVWTRFHPDAIPDWFEEEVDTPQSQTATPLHLQGRTSIHQVRRAFGPGALLLRWGYGERE